MTRMDATGWAPESCTLPTVERPLREQEFERLFRDHLRKVRRVTPTIAELELAAGSAEPARDLARRETGCCSFFSFDVRDGEEGVVLTVEVPPLNVPVLDALLVSATSATSAAAAAPTTGRAAAPVRPTGVRP